jgi:hypothetical protein
MMHLHLSGFCYNNQEVASVTCVVEQTKATLEIVSTDTMMLRAVQAEMQILRKFLKIPACVKVIEM